ncbi:anthranilate synthase component I [Pradoshia eiseniae]|uniref:Anthranilate synthase component 1 n=1 Tax=Pradoshia eiseniae TaxID=2064768 RepID=A0A2S7N4P4_9BACI|nr:chorismate-binding protein [Pradoshia eiseniae]PQD97041.1 anthranilate synthase component I [Pradoshia eiseniae]
MKERHVFRRTISGEERARAAELEKMKGIAILDFPSLQHGRVRILALNVHAELSQKNGIMTVKSRGRVETVTEDAQKHLQHWIDGHAESESCLPFSGGAIGYIGYSYSFQFENLNVPELDLLDMNDLHLLFHSDYFIFSGAKGEECEQVHVHYGSPIQANEAEKRMASVLDQASFSRRAEPSYSIGLLSSNFTKASFMEAVDSIKSHIRAGDIFQAVLSQRWSGEFKGDSLTYFLKIKAQHPSSFSFYLPFENYEVLGCSPERLLAVDQGIVHSNPIAGTRRRGSTNREDEQLIRDLLSDEKEKAEHLMLVDLARNDLGKICRKESILLNRFMEIEKYKNVIHLVSEITGTLAEDIHPADAVKACLPAGTVSGAPKIRAMELISTYEQEKRGVYGGGVGYFSFEGNSDLALAIRMAVVKDGMIHQQAGAGIVHDSIPENEWHETLHKAGVKEAGLNDFTYR